MTSAPPAARYRGRHELVRRAPRLPAVRSHRRRRRWPAPVLILAAGALAVVRHLHDPALTTLAAVATVLLTGVLARRLGLSLPATALAAIVTAVLPWAVAGHRLDAPVNLAVPWLLGAAVLVSAGRRRAVLLAAPCLLVAVVATPLVVPIGLVTAAVLLADRDLGAGWSPANRVAGVAVLAVLAAGVFVIVSRLWRPVPDVEPGTVDLAVGAVIVVGAAAGTIVRWLRPFALVVLGCVAVAAAAAPVRTPLLLLALPAAAIVLGAAVDATATAVRPSRRDRLAPN